MNIKGVIIIGIIISIIVIISIFALTYIIFKIHDIKSNKKKRDRTRD